MISGLAVLVLLAILVAVFTTNRGKFPVINLLNPRTVKWVLGVYAGVLLLSLAVLYMLPHEGFLGSNSNPVNADIFAAAKAGKLEQTPGIFAKSRWSFAYNAGQLAVETNPETVIYAERKDIDDGKIDIVYYLGKNSFDGVDYTDKIKPPLVQLVGNKLVVTDQAPSQLQFARFQKEFTQVQFSRDKANGLFSTSHQGVNEQVLFCRIPKSLNMNGRITFIKK